MKIVFISFFFSLQHLLCLLLQALACLALNPALHAPLNEAEVSDMLMQLLLPSDEWYYTNHSTKYAKFVKYHAARILVYMGLFHKLGGRVDLFDRRRKYCWIGWLVVWFSGQAVSSLVALRLVGWLVGWLMVT